MASALQFMLPLRALTAAQCQTTEVCRLQYPLLPAYTSTLLYAGFAVVLLIFFYGVYRKFRVYGLGRMEIFQNLHRLAKGFRQLVKVGFGQSKILQRRFGGVMHSWMFYGITALTVGTILVGIDYDILRPNGVVLLQGNFYVGFKVALDLLGLAFVIAVALAMARRLSFKPFYMGEDRGDIWLLVGMLYIGVSGFVQEGLRLALIPVPWGYFSPIGSTVALVFTTAGASPQSAAFASWVSAYEMLWWVHALVAFALIASIPYAKLFHIPDSIINMVLYDEERPLGRMSTPFNLMELMKQQEANPDASMPDLKLGITTTNDLNWAQKVMLDSCTNCGRCEAACPASAAGRDLSPRIVVQDLKNQFYNDYKQIKEKKGEAIDLLTSGVIRQEEMYSCVMCAACVYECPVMINQLDFISDLRRSLVTTNRLDNKQTTLLSNLASNQNPYGFRSDTRADWARDSGVKTLVENPSAEYLYWVGCLCSFDHRAQKVARSLAKLMNEAGVSFAILGNEESCTGDPARRLGEEGRYQELAAQNIEKLNSHGVKKIVTSCPHCYNTIRNEYRTFGGRYEVIHHSQLISNLVKDGRIKLSTETIKDVSSVTLHDACYAVRFNDIFEEPRAVLNAAGVELREMYRCKQKTFCCGAGGANYWYKVPQQRTITSIRTEEASETGATMLATECPFCLSMFEDSVQVSGTEMTVRDIAEIVSEALSDRDRKKT